ncbi:hypothetical protein H8356DRAFT_1283449 [Neocallimastix lanati (nom. inval.)]|nr:hypothetical protein H8356DRAFT_1283449 [Neocallimastix sp. JGI-2020a]
MRNNNFTGNRVDTGTLLRIGGSRRDTETWKFKIIDWFKREGITTNENKYSYIITAVEDDIVRILMEKEKEVNRALTLDECSFISVIDYENALQPRGRIYEMVAMADVDNLEDACRLAEKFEIKLKD